MLIERQSISKEIVIGLVAWFILNVIQATFTELGHDEAYYWLYSKNLAWGYFDHPPLVAILIKAGYFLLQQELGVRLLFIALSTFTIYLLYRICLPEKTELVPFFLIIFSIPLVHVGGFLAAPDIPLIFFTTLFFYLYKSYTKEDSLMYALYLAITMALLMYSKYHGILVIFFTFISNLALLKRRSFWMMSVLAIIFYAPHLHWQLVNDFPTLKYHLVERTESVYKFEYTLNYLLGQVLIVGPLAGVLLFIAAFGLKTTNSFVRALKFSLIGILIFFLINSFRSRVEANWTSTAFIPLIILSFNSLRNNHSLRKWTIGLGIPALILIVCGRIILMLPTLPFKAKLKSEYHMWEKWARVVHAKANGLPVIFMNSYQKASKYAFYTGEMAHSLNNFMYRKNQFDLWKIEDTLQGKKVFLILNFEGSEDTFKIPDGGIYHYRIIDNFRSYNKVSIESHQKKLKAHPKDSVNMSIKLTNKGSYDANFLANPEFPSQLTVNIYTEEPYPLINFYPLKPTFIKVGEESKQEVKFIAPEKKGKYRFRVAIATGWLPYGLNSDLYELEIL